MKWLLAFVLVCWCGAASAQCSGNGGVPFNCVTGGTPQVGDLVLGGSNTSPLAGDTVAWTWGNVFAAGLPGTLSSLTIGSTLEYFPASGLLAGTTDTQTLTGKSIAATEVNSGTLASAQIAGSYTGITGVGTLTAGAIGSGFTSINATPVGAATASTGAFTTLSASSTVSGSGFSTYLASPPAIGGTAPAAGTFTALAGATVATTTNCSSSASPAVCGAAAAGSVAVPTGTDPTLVVDTSAVTANSQILLTVDESLGTKLGVTCNTTISTLAPAVVTARTAGISFTIEIGATVASNPACLSYVVVN